jgi:ABC-type multidrug transport system permease subunit
MSHVISESLVFARRHIAHIRQIPEKLIDVTLQPIMFTLLFGYVFGAAITIPGGSYREYMVGGVLIQTLTFGIMGPAVSIATDMREGVVDRFRSLPISRASYLMGHILAETGATLIGVTVLSLSGLILGWGIYSSIPAAIAGYGLIILYAFVMVWVGTWLGLMVRSPDAAQGVIFMTAFPLTFVASTFIPLGGLSPILKAFASWNPVSTLATALRILFGNPTALAADAAWPLRHPIGVSLAWCVAIGAIAIPMSIRAFRRKTID